MSQVDREVFEKEYESESSRLEVGLSNRVATEEQGAQDEAGESQASRDSEAKDSPNNTETRNLGKELLIWAGMEPGAQSQASGTRDGPKVLPYLTQRKRSGPYLEGGKARAGLYDAGLSKITVEEDIYRNSEEEIWRDDEGTRVASSAERSNFSPVRTRVRSRLEQERGSTSQVRRAHTNQNEDNGEAKLSGRRRDWKKEARDRSQHGNRAATEITQFRELQGSQTTINSLKALISKHKPQGVFLMETKINKEKLGKICKSLFYNKTIIVNPTGRAGGHAMEVICLLWTLILRDKSIFWNAIATTISLEDLPWCIIGDLNEITNDADKIGGRMLHRKGFLNSFVQESAAIDLGFKGSRYTWCNNQAGRSRIRERLDRAYVNKASG
ncbi:hypothetical protein FNV43_RR21272 [Rhamnella rubrinervis]|uniref:Endonuclease/exonuclease/phosphatase n=1 Tax=Rhamnella rubrinervis TaxID=2594499 RepID=A0A8K0E312_9ROSA|nr:hypothetical protein FNV43_RR21272 [Rhamnella rubrinervis]